jgi:hypothetical protein
MGEASKMRFLLIALLPALLTAAPNLQVVKAVLSQMEDGAPDPPGFIHVPGETLYFTCRIAGYSKNADNQIHLAYSIQAFDPKGVPLTEIYKNDMQDEVSPQDKEWMPKIQTEVAIPPLIPSGDYKILVKVEDLIAKTQTEFPLPFKVRGHEITPSDTLTVSNFHYYRAENDTQPLEKAAYKPGDGVWARFDITGYKYGEKNKIDVSYVTTVNGARVIWTQPEPATERSESYYPKLYVPANFGITLQPNFKPGEYSIGVQVKDAVSGQTYEAKFPFTVE